MIKTSEKKYLYPGMDWDSFEEKLDNLSFQKSFWESLKNGIKKCLQFLGILFLALAGLLVWYIQSHETLNDFWQKHISIEGKAVEKTEVQASSSQDIPTLLYEYHQKMLKHITQKNQELQLQEKQSQNLIKEVLKEKGKCEDILKDIKFLKEALNTKATEWQSAITVKGNKAEVDLILKEQKSLKDEIKKNTEQFQLLQSQLKEWQSSAKDIGSKEDISNSKEAQPVPSNKTASDNIQMYHYRTLFPPSLLVYLPQNYHKFFIGFQLTNLQYTVKEKYYLYQNFVPKGWYQIRLENWYKRDYRLKILYTHPFDLLPVDYKILELTADYSMPQNIKTIRAFPIDEILNVDPGYGFVELLKREF